MQSYFEKNWIKFKSLEDGFQTAGMLARLILISSANYATVIKSLSQEKGSGLEHFVFSVYLSITPHTPQMCCF